MNSWQRESILAGYIAFRTGWIVKSLRLLRQRNGEKRDRGSAFRQTQPSWFLRVVSRKIRESASYWTRGGLWNRRFLRNPGRSYWPATSWAPACTMSARGASCRERDLWGRLLMFDPCYTLPIY